MQQKYLQIFASPFSRPCPSSNSYRRHARPISRQSRSSEETDIYEDIHPAKTCSAHGPVVPVTKSDNYEEVPKDIIGSFEIQS